jgi:hypothetical protein
MDTTLWIKNINSLNISTSVKETIISFFDNFKLSNSLNFIKITKNIVTRSLNNINNYKPILLCMDAEFQSSTDLKYVRELGILIFVRDKNEIYYYVGYIFVNFQSITKYNVDVSNLKPLFSTYSTVTKHTLNEMENNEKVFKLELIVEPLEDKKLFKDHNKYRKLINNTIEKINNNYIYNNILNENLKKSIMSNFNNLQNINNYNSAINEINALKKKLMKAKFEVYGGNIKNTNLYDNFIKAHELYWNDEYVKKRLSLTKNKEELFFELFAELSENSMFMIKGIQDFNALNNSLSLFNYKIKLNFDSYYDIETFNGLSNFLYNSSQLENTYKNIVKTKVYIQFAKPIFDVILNNIGDKAHNPVVDSLFTIIVAVTINIGLVKYFDKS